MSFTKHEHLLHERAGTQETQVLTQCCHEPAKHAISLSRLPFLTENTEAAQQMLPSGSLLLGQPRNVCSVARPQQAPGSENSKLSGLRRCCWGVGRSPPCVPRGPGGAGWWKWNLQDAIMAWQGRGQTGFCNSPRSCKQGVSDSQVLLVCLVWRGVCPSRLFSEMAGLSLVLGQGHV